MIEWIFNKSGAEIVCLQEVFSKEHRALFWARAEQSGWTFLAPQDHIYGGYVPGLENGSGLLTLLHPRFKITAPPTFEAYRIVNGADRVVKKGFFTVHVNDNIHTFQIINTHMQSDITEACCIRVNFNAARHAQEEQLFIAASKYDFPLIAGDANTCIFKCFHRVDQETHVTFPDTEEHLDHLLCLSQDMRRIDHIRTEYHDDMLLSDHIPVVYHFDLFQKRS